MSPEQGVINHQHDNRSDHGDNHAVEIKTGDAAGAHGGEEEAPTIAPTIPSIMSRKKPSPVRFTTLLAMNPEISPNIIHPSIDILHLLT
jgi:hypothetical protein